MTPPQLGGEAPSAHAPRPAGDAGIASHAVEVVDRPGPAWDEMTAYFADAAYEQSVAYTATRWGGERLVGLVVRDAWKRPVAMALAVTVEVPVVGAGFAHVKFGPLWRPHGIETSPETLTQALVALRRELGERRGLLVRVMPPAAPGFDVVWTASLAAAGFASSAAVAHPERYLMDLSLSDDEQLASFGDRWRAQLKKSSRDLTFEEIEGDVALAQFFPMFRSMLQRKRFDDRHGVDALPALLAHPVPGHRTRVFVACHAAEPVALSVIGGAGDTVHALFGATSDRALPLRAGYALRWWVLGRLRGRGARWLDLGGDEGTRDCDTTRRVAWGSAGGSCVFRVSSTGVSGG
jgi:hypothetical protein